MKRVLIHYFTGTGNTEHAIKLIKEELEKNDMLVITKRIEANFSIEENEFDYHIFAFPVYGFAPPYIFRDYLRKIKSGDNVKTAILSINGASVKKDKIISGFSAYSTEYVEKILKRKNYNIFLSDNFSYPENWTQLMNSLDIDNISRVFKQSDKNIYELTEKFINDKKSLYRSGIIGKFIFRLFIPIFMYFARRLLGKFYIADKKCNSCGVCIKTCPAKAIKMFGKKPVWGINCLACNRCINICPRSAIQTSIFRLMFHLIGSISLWITIILCIIRNTSSFIPFFNNFLSAITIIFLIFISSAILLIFQLTIFDYIIRLLEKIPFIRPLFELSYTKKYRRYIAKDFRV